MIIERDLQPLESFVFLSSHRVELSDLIRQPIPPVGDEVSQSRICSLTISDHVLRNRELETAITFVRFQFRFAKRRFITARDSNEYLVAMSGSGRRLQLRRFP